jgi:hypothetical protein
VLGYSNGFTANLAARTEELDLNPLFRKIAPASKDSSKASRKKVVELACAPKGSVENFSGSKFEFNVQLFAKKLVARKVEGSFANADLNYKNDVITVKSVNLNTCEGKIFARGTLEEFSRLRADVEAKNVNVKTLFTEFENFGQQAVVSENLKGILNVEAKFRSELDEKFEVIPETMSGEVRLKLRDGHLINYEPVQNMSNLLFRNRDFNDVTFSELTETFHLEGYKMKIEELEVASNVLNFYVVDGIYNFKGNSNINLLVPWSNIKKRGKNYIPKSSGQSAEHTKGLKLNFQGPSKNMKLTFGHKQTLDS